jgi:hypothetical protein
MKKRTFAFALSGALALSTLIVSSALVSQKKLTVAGGDHSNHDSDDMKEIGFDWRDPTKDGYKAYYRCPNCCASDPSSSRYSIFDKTAAVSESDIKLSALASVDSNSIKGDAIIGVDPNSYFGLDQARNEGGITYFVNDGKKDALYVSRSREQSKTDGSYAHVDYSSFLIDSNLEEGVSLGSISFSYRYLNYGSTKMSDSEIATPFAAKMSFAYGESSKGCAIDSKLTSDGQWHTISISMSEAVGVDSLSDFKSLAFKFSDLEGYFMISGLRFSAETKEEIDKRLGITLVFSEDKSSLTYGFYPYDHVADTATIASLNKLSESEKLNGYYFLNGDYYAKRTSIVEKDHSGFLTFDDGTTLYKDTEYWFKCKAITWNVLYSENASLYSIVSGVILDVHRYNESYEGLKEGYYANSYQNSELRKWLNDDFFWTAFALDRGQITSSLVADTVESSGCDTRIGNSYVTDTSWFDFVYIQSAKDMSATGDPCGLSDWAKASGCLFIEDSKVGDHWTRSPSSTNSNCALATDYKQNINATQVDDAENGVRPCIRVHLSE